MLVEDIMSAPVVSVPPSASIGEAAGLMLAHRISGLPVVTSDGKLVGMVSEGDFLRRGELGTERKRSAWLEFFVSPGKSADEYVRTHGRTVQEVMTGDVITIRRKAALDEVVEAMSTHHVKRLPVVDNGKLVGIISRSDLLRAVTRALPTGDVAATNDQRIRTAILDELASQRWSRHGLIRVDVQNGKVELSGTILDERERKAACVAAENTPGVQSVSDQLVWVEPMSGIVMLPEEAHAAESDAKS